MLLIKFLKLFNLHFICIVFQILQHNSQTIFYLFFYLFNISISYNLFLIICYFYLNYLILNINFKINLILVLINVLKFMNINQKINFIKIIKINFMFHKINMNLIILFDYKYIYLFL